MSDLSPAVVGLHADDRPLPVALVDRNDVRWTWTAAGYRTHGSPSTYAYEELDERFSPLRPIVPPTPDDCEKITVALREAGLLAIGSVLAAINRLFNGPPLFIGGTEIAMMQATTEQRAARRSLLLAGRPGSRESSALGSIAYFDTNDLAADPSRYREQTVDVIVDVVWGWITHPEHYTEVASNLAIIVGEHVITAGGWHKVSDRSLQPGDKTAASGAERVFDLLSGVGKSIQTNVRGKQ